jgi:hypothetical protein
VREESLDSRPVLGEVVDGPSLDELSLDDTGVEEQIDHPCALVLHSIAQAAHPLELGDHIESVLWLDPPFLPVEDALGGEADLLQLLVGHRVIIAAGTSAQAKVFRDP